MLNIIDIFTDIVRIDSESCDEKSMSNYIQQFLQARDLQAQVDKLWQIYVALPGQGEPLLFSAHLDTVPPGKAIKPQIQADGKITSDGSTILGGDDKSGVALLLWLIDYLTQQPVAQRRAVEIVFTTREEISPSGASQFDLSLIKSKLGFIFDKGNTELNTVVRSAAFINEVEIEFIGKSAHAANPESAINSLALLNVFLNQLTLGRPYPQATLNFGLVSGGDAANTIPERIRITGDYRANDQMTIDQIRQQIEQAKQVVLTQFPQSQVNINTIVYCHGYQHEPSSLYIDKLRQAYQKAGFDTIKLLDTQAGSDACIFNNSGTGLEVFNLANGVYNMHSVSEYVYSQSLVKLTEIVKELLRIED
jgi:tripeptide aminopeptidase